MLWNEKLHIGVNTSNNGKYKRLKTKTWMNDINNSDEYPDGSVSMTSYYSMKPIVDRSCGVYPSVGAD